MRLIQNLRSNHQHIMIGGLILIGSYVLLLLMNLQHVGVFLAALYACHEIAWTWLAGALFLMAGRLLINPRRPHGPIVNKMKDLVPNQDVLSLIIVLAIVLGTGTDLLL